MQWSHVWIARVGASQRSNGRQMTLLTWSHFNKNKNTINKEKTNSPKIKTQKQSRARGVEQKEKEDSGGYLDFGGTLRMCDVPYPTSVRL